jgi:hypothetical protein
MTVDRQRALVSGVDPDALSGCGPVEPVVVAPVPA